MNYINFKPFDELAEQGYLRKVISPCGNFLLYNYSDFCTYQKHWNEYTLVSRGTVYDLSGKVVARAFNKYFNLSELPEEKQNALMQEKNFRTFEKVDGSFLLLAYYGDAWRCTTRGSFTSDQAVKAAEILKKYDISNLNKNYSYLCEVIYPENKIIVDYGKKEELILLAVLHTSSGVEIENYITPFPTAIEHSYSSIDELLEIQAKLSHQDEGFVVKFNSGERVKIKSLEYLRIARIKSNMSPLAFWEKMKDGSVDPEFLASIPEELRAESESIAEQLENVYGNVLLDIVTTINVVFCAVFEVTEFDVKKVQNNKENCKKLGLYLKANPDTKHSVCMFHYLLNNDEAMDKYIIKEIRPTGNIVDNQLKLDYT